MTWFAIYREDTGECVSYADVVADPLPVGLAKVAISGAPDLARDEWDPVQRQLVARPVPEALDLDAILNPVEKGFKARVEAMNPKDREVVADMVRYGILSGPRAQAIVGQLDD